MIRLAGSLSDGSVLGGGNDSRVDCILICRDYSLLLILGGNLLPQGLTALATAIPDVEGKELAIDGVHGNPDPLSIHLLPDTAPELVHLGVQTL
jgi:hypothetical protein